MCFWVTSKLSFEIQSCSSHLSDFMDTLLWNAGSAGVTISMSSYTLLAILLGVHLEYSVHQGLEGGGGIGHRRTMTVGSYQSFVGDEGGFHLSPSLMRTLL